MNTKHAVDRRNALPDDPAPGRLRRLARKSFSFVSLLMNKIHELLDSIRHTSARSSVLANLNWIIGMLLITYSSSFVWGTPSSQLFIEIVTGLYLAFYLGMHWYFAVKNPDALRSERFSISKMAIDRGLIGDNVRGILDPESLDPEQERNLIENGTGGEHE